MVSQVELRLCQCVCFVMKSMQIHNNSINLTQILLVYHGISRPCRSYTIIIYVNIFTVCMCRLYICTSINFVQPFNSQSSSLKVAPWLSPTPSTSAGAWRRHKSWLPVARLGIKMTHEWKSKVHFFRG